MNNYEYLLFARLLRLKQGYFIYLKIDIYFFKMTWDMLERLIWLVYVKRCQMCFVTKFYIYTVYIN